MKEMRKFSGAQIKILAIISMTIDHIGAALIEKYPGWNQLPDSVCQNLTILDFFLRLVGRLAFPLFIFLLMEGFIHTRNVGKYVLRLLVFALISEPAFDLAFNGKALYLKGNSIFLTLAIGLSCCYAIKLVRERFFAENTRKNGWLMLLVELAALLAGGGLGTLLHTDYEAAGVCAIILMYMLYDKNKISAYIISVGFLSATCGITELFALVGCYFIYNYSGERGRQNKYFFYAYYPAHLLVLSLIRYIL